MTNYIFDIETTGLDSIKDRITCIILLDLNESRWYSFVGDNEKLLLTQFWGTLLQGEQEDTIIGFNSDTFDIPFIIKRSIIHNVKITKFKNIDLKKIVNSFFYSYNKYDKGSLRDWASILDFKIKTENGEQMIKYFNDKNFNEISKHCEEDVEATKKLYERCKEVGLINGKG